MLVIQCDDDFLRESPLRWTFKTEKRSVVATENLHLENASLPMDTKMGNKNISPEWLDLGNIYSDLFCVLSLLTLLEVFFELQPSYYALLHATHPMYILLLIYMQLSLKPLLV